MFGFLTCVIVSGFIFYKLNDYILHTRGFINQDVCTLNILGFHGLYSLEVIFSSSASNSSCRRHWPTAELHTVEAHRLALELAEGVHHRNVEATATL